MNQNAIELLKADHVKVKQLLSELTDSSNQAVKTRQKLLEQVAKELEVHTRIEEEVFYPAFREAGTKSDDPMYFEAKEEHRAVESLVLPDLEKTDPGTDQFAGRVKVLKELVEHHADEEESDMFPRAEEILSQDQLMHLGKQMAELKSNLMQS